MGGSVYHEGGEYRGHLINAGMRHARLIANLARRGDSSPWCGALSPYSTEKRVCVGCPIKLT